MISLDALLANTRRSGDCLIWKGTIRKDGYPQIGIDGKKLKVTRLVVELLQGKTGTKRKPIAPDRAVVHKHECTSSACINPVHLMVVNRKYAWQYRKNEAA